MEKFKSLDPVGIGKIGTFESTLEDYQERQMQQRKNNLDEVTLFNPYSKLIIGFLDGAPRGDFYRANFSQKLSQASWITT